MKLSKTFYRIAYFVDGEFDSWMDDCYTYSGDEEGLKEAIIDAAILYKEVTAEIRANEEDYTVDYRVYKEVIKYTSV